MSKKNRKRFLSILVTAVLIFTLALSSVMAQDEEHVRSDKLNVNVETEEVEDGSVETEEITGDVSEEADIEDFADEDGEASAAEDAAEVEDVSAGDDAEEAIVPFSAFVTEDVSPDGEDTDTDYLTVQPHGITYFAAGDVASVEYNVTYHQNEARSMLSKVNEFRTGSDANHADATGAQTGNVVSVTGLEGYVYDYDLEAIAMQRAAELVLSYSHTRPNGKECFSAVENYTNYTYTALGENIAYAYGYTSAEATEQVIFEGWLEENETFDNQGHRLNMLGGIHYDEGTGYTTYGFNRIGIACVSYEGTYYWVQEFATSENVSSETASNNDTETVSVSVLSDDLTVTVVPDSDSYIMEVNASQDLPEVQVTYASIPVSVEFTWASSDQAVATIEDGKIVAKSAGTAKVTASAEGLDNIVISVTVYEEGQTLIHYEAKDATCTNDGNMEYWYRIDTGKYYSDEDCTKEISKNDTVIAALGHDYVGVETKAATCTETGEMTYTCSRCDDTYTETIAALGHDYVGEVTTEATCTEAGEMTYTCSRCGDIYTEEIAALGHDWVVTEELISSSEDRTERLVSLSCSRGDVAYDAVDIVVETVNAGITAHTSFGWEDIISADDLADLLTGGAESIDFALSIEAYNEAVSSDDKALTEAGIAALCGDQEYTVYYLDIDATMSVNWADGTSETMVCAETANPVAITVTIPDELLSAAGDTYYVLRIHNGVAEVLYSEADETTITFSSDRFSTYALVKTTTPVDGDVDDTDDADGSALSGTPKTNDSGRLTLWIVLAVVAVAAIASVLGISRRRVR